MKYYQYPLLLLCQQYNIRQPHQNQPVSPQLPYQQSCHKPLPDVSDYQYHQVYQQSPLSKQFQKARKQILQGRKCHPLAYYLLLVCQYLRHNNQRCNIQEFQLCIHMLRLLAHRGHLLLQYSGQQYQQLLLPQENISSQKNAYQLLVYYQRRPNEILTPVICQMKYIYQPPLVLIQDNPMLPLSAWLYPQK